LRGWTIDLVLQRHQFIPDGIFGSLVSPDNIVAVTLEHAYQMGDATKPGVLYYPKVPPGIYKCVRGMHRLENMKSDFETFEVTDVPGHTGILFHIGNFLRDSRGCILLGSAMIDDGNGYMISGSKIAFQKFMNLQQRVDSFHLTIVEDPRPNASTPD
jgi:hypothetical protein